MAHTAYESAVQRMDIHLIHFIHDLLEQICLHDFQEFLAGFKDKPALQGTGIIVQVFPLAVCSHQH